MAHGRMVAHDLPVPSDLPGERYFQNMAKLRRRRRSGKMTPRCRKKVAVHREKLRFKAPVFMYPE